jgi:hypothetical protein
MCIHVLTGNLNPQEFAKEEETLRAAYQSVHGIYELLQSPEQKDADANPPPPLEEVSLDAAPFSLQQQFSYRAPFLHGKKIETSA